MRNTRRGLTHPRLFCAVMIALIVGLGSVVAYIAIYDPDPLKNTRNTEYTYESTNNYANSTEVTTQETITNTEATAVPAENTTIEIVGGSKGEYYRAFCYNELCNNPEDKQIIDCYFIPAGTYRLTNNSGYPRQITVYNANSLTVNDNGFEEFSDGLVSDGLIADGQAVEVTIEPGYFLKTTNTTSNPDRLSLVPQGEIVEQDLSLLSSRFYEDSLFIDTNKVPTEATTVETTKETTKKQTETTTQTTEAPTETTQKSAAEERDYIINTNSGVFHKSSCGSGKRTKESNRKAVHCTREELISQGYTPCGNCNP